MHFPVEEKMPRTELLRSGYRKKESQNQSSKINDIIINITHKLCERRQVERVCLNMPNVFGIFQMHFTVLRYELIVFLCRAN